MTLVGIIIIIMLCLAHAPTVDARRRSGIPPAIEKSAKVHSTSLSPNTDNNKKVSDVATKVRAGFDLHDINKQGVKRRRIDKSIREKFAENMAKAEKIMSSKKRGERNSNEREREMDEHIAK